jgi:hypothetical protein
LVVTEPEFHFAWIFSDLILQITRKTAGQQLPIFLANHTSACSGVQNGVTWFVTCRGNMTHLWQWLRLFRPFGIPFEAGLFHGHGKPGQTMDICFGRLKLIYQKCLHSLAKDCLKGFTGQGLDNECISKLTCGVLTKLTETYRKT